MNAAAHWGAFRDTSLMWKSSLKTWLTQRSNLNSHDAVLDLFNFCIVLYVRFRYFLEFTFAIPGFLLLAKKMRQFLETNGEKMIHRYSVFWRGYLYSWVTLGVFWGVCTCSNSIYTTIPMPLYSYLVSPVSWNLEFIHNTYYFWWEFSLRRKQKPEVLCFTLIEIVCDVDDAFNFLLLLPAVLWTHSETMQCFVVDTKSTFFRRLISAPSIQK